MGARDRRLKELEQAAGAVRGYIEMDKRGHGDGLAWTRQELEASLSEICLEAETLTEERARQGGLKRWL